MILPVYRIHTTYCLHHIKEGLEDRITDRFLCCTCWHLLMSFLVFFTSGLRLLVTKCSSCGFCSKCSTDRLLDSKKREASRIARALTLTLYTIVQSRGLLTTMQFPSLCVRCATAGFRAFFFSSETHEKLAGAPTQELQEKDSFQKSTKNRWNGNTVWHIIHIQTNLRLGCIQ